MSQDDVQKTSIEVLMKDVLKTKNKIQDLEELLGDNVVDGELLKQKNSEDNTKRIINDNQ